MRCRSFSHTAFFCSGLALSAACREANQANVGARDTTERSVSETRRAVEAAAQSHWTAINNGDTLTVLRQHAPELTIIASESERRFTIPSVDADRMIAQFWRGAKPSFTIRDLQVQVYGDAAVATFYLDGGTTLASGHVDRRVRRVTEVWAHQPDGTWKEAHHHDSVFLPTGAGIGR